VGVKSAGVSHYSNFKDTSTPFFFPLDLPLAFFPVVNRILLGFWIGSVDLLGTVVSGQCGLRGHCTPFRTFSLVSWDVGMKYFRRPKRPDGGPHRCPSDPLPQVGTPKNSYGIVARKQLKTFNVSVPGSRIPGS